MTKSKIPETTESKRSSGFLRLFISLILVIGAVITASADNYWYQNGGGPEVYASSDGSFTVKILTYNFDGMDDWLSYIKVYMKAAGNNYQKLFEVRCKHEYDNGDFKEGYGNIYDKAADYTFSTYTSSDGDLRYRFVTVKVPQYIWGKIDIKTEVDWRYSHYGSENKYYREFLNQNIGDCRANLVSKCTYFKPDPDGYHYTVSVSNIPQVENCKTELFLDLNGTSKSYAVNSTDTTIVLNLPNGTSIEKENNVITDYVKLKYGNNTAETPSDKRDKMTAAPYVVVDDLKADYSSENREVTLTWKLKNISESEYKYQVFRRTLNNSGNAIDDYVLTNSGTVKTDKDNTVTVTNSNTSGEPITTNRNYEYKVVMLRPKWTNTDVNSNWGGTAHVTITTSPKINISLKAEGEPHAIRLNWAIPYCQEFEGKTIEIYRKDPKGTTQKIGETFFESQSAMVDRGKGTFLDDGIDYNSGEEPFSGKFKYWIRLLATETWYKCDFESEQIEGVTTDISYIKEVRATKGEFAGKVGIDWDVRLYRINGEIRKSTYSVSRRQMETDDAEYQQLTQFDSDAEYLTYTDEEALPGVYYDYKVTMKTQSSDGSGEYEQTMGALGFSSAYGKVSGRITYGSGVAVEGVDIVAIPSSNDGTFRASRCLYFANTGASAVCNFTENRASTYFGGNFTTQFWINPLTKPLSIAADPNEKDLHSLINFCNHYRITLLPKADGYQMGYSKFDVEGQLLESNIIIEDFPADKYSHVTLAVQGDQMRVTVFTPEADQITESTFTATGIEPFFTEGFKPVIKIGGGTLGLVDDFRIWKRVLTPEEVRNNYNTSLVGNESDLVAYWRFDEGLTSQFFDASKNGTMMNANHGILEAGVKSTTLVPDATLLAYRCISDIDGNYMIDGIPFGGNGTGYNIVPSLGIHQFNPNKDFKFVGPNSLVFNGCDFSDVSSFPVKGVIYYKNTTYPLEGCNLYIDGVICVKDEKPVVTNDAGEFMIDVPIGKHRVEARMPNHDFGQDGVYEHEFNQPVTNLTFYDNTLVNLTGRVTGGNVEGNKPLGFGASVATIGQATIEMEPIRTGFSLNSVIKTDETMSWTENNPEELICPIGEGAESTINSKSYRGAGEQAGKIFIKTDPATGEFSAMVPPLEYRINTASTKNIVVESNMPLNLADVVGVWETDTIVPDSVLEQKLQTLEYAYNKGIRLTYHSEPTFTVEQEDAQPGAFGIETCEVKDLFGSQILNVYTVQPDGSISYNYGESRNGSHHVPIFKMGEFYTFKLKGFEEYVNEDDEANPRVSIVPLAGSEVTIRNELSDGQPIALEEGEDGIKPGDVAEMQSEKQVLDDNGEALYLFCAGLPNITAPYTRTIAMDYLVGESHKSWSGNGMEAIVIGNMPNQNNNFVTEGPDHVNFVLRDPPGSRSSAQWKEGVTSSFTRYYGGVANETAGGSQVMHLSLENTYGVGFCSNLSLTRVKNINEQKIGATVKVGYEGGGTCSTQTQISQTISTSDSPSFVGSDGDIYMGLSTNIIFGSAKNVGFWRETAGAPFVLDKREGVSTTNITFETAFNYTQHYIINYLIPNYRSLLASTLQHADMQTITNFVNETDRVIYLTPLKPDNANFGTYNCDSIAWGKEAAPVGCVTGPSYWMFLPQGADEEGADEEAQYRDDVAFYISQIKNWESIIAANEKDKIEAFNNRDGDKDKRTLIQNYSFDAGAKINHSESYSSASGSKHDVSLIYNIMRSSQTGVLFNGAGGVFTYESVTNFGTHDNFVENTDTTTVLTFTLAEDGTKDALTVDVMKSPAKWGMVFHTRGGQTSNPYEGEERTKYYEPGKYVLNEATMQIEKPMISVDETILNDIPVGGAANFTLRLTNESEIGENLSYILKVTEDSNPDGAQLTIDGEPLTSAGRSIKVPYGQVVTKTLQLRQSNLGIVNYDDIELVFCSSSESSLKATALISAHFVPTSTDVRMILESNIINTSSGSDFTVKFDGFDLSHTGLKAFRIQLKPEGALNWTTVKEFVLKEEDLANDNELLPSGQPVEYNFSMKNYDDGRYLFRVISVSMNGGSEITSSSEEMLVTKDMSRPTWISLPSPTNGILGIGDEVGVTFNEDINQGMIHKADNFILSGRLNGASVDHDGVFCNNGSLGARTQASIDLSRRSFSIGTYLRWSKGGTIVRHGTSNNNFSIDVLDDGKLLVKIAGKEYISEGTVPKDTWCYLNVAYDCDQGTPKLYADYGDAAGQYSLIDGKEAPIYECNAPLAVGDYLTGVVHEVTLWNYRRLPQVAFNEISLPKTASTDGLIGYWPLNEGHGNIGEDKARNRHFSLGDGNTWHLETGNYAMALENDSYALLDISSASTDIDSNYLLEFWVKAPAASLTSTIVQTGDHNLELLASGDGALILKFGSETKQIAVKDFFSNIWHHVALNVLKGTSGTATLYIDGNAVMQCAASQIPALQGDFLIFGAHRTVSEDYKTSYSQYFTGEIDEVRLWHGTYSASTIREKMYTRVLGDTEGLKVYYPFDVTTLDSFNQPVTNPDLAEQSRANAADARVLRQQGTGVEAGVTDWNREDAPGLKQAKLLANLDFSFTTSDRRIRIDLNDDPERIEGSMLTFTVRNVQDLNGNVCQPITWTAYVDQCPLIWSESEITITTSAGNPAEFTAEAVNRSGENVDWYLTSMPMWLTASTEGGTLKPSGTQKIRFTIGDGVAIGRYEAVVKLMSTSGVAANLVVTLKVVGEKPDWSVDATKYENNMNIIGKIMLDGIYSEDPDDMIAAFIGNECRGVAMPVYYPRYDSYITMLTVYGNDADRNKPLTFKMYDASCGLVYPNVSASNELKFIVDAIEGTMGNPIIWTIDDSREQNQPLPSGWNWVSLYVAPDDTSVASVMGSVGDNCMLVKGKEKSAMYEGGWFGEMSMAPGELYKIKMVNAAEWDLSGGAVDPAETPIDVMPGWNWIGFPSSSYMNISDAFADLNPHDGDVVKGRFGFAMYDDYGWSGSLTALQPGQGYVYKSTDTEAKTFRFPAIAMLTAPLRMPTDAKHKYTPCDPHKYEGNMTIIAQVMNNGMPIDCEVAVFDSKGECRASAFTQGDRCLAFLTVQGEGSDESLTFRVVYTDADKEVDVEAHGALNYENDAIIGTPSAPFILNLGDVGLGLDDASADDGEDVIYNIKGQRVYQTRSGFYIKNGEKVGLRQQK